jgi:transcriptional regulator with GAF, ATPase, and Fis domain
MNVKTRSILFSWIGMTDLRAAADPTIGLGPLASALVERRFETAVLLNNFSQDQIASYLIWLKKTSSSAITVAQCALSSPTDFAQIYTIARATVKQFLHASDAKAKLTFHLSPGTPAMAAVWIILAKTQFGAELIESSVQQGVRTVSFPFDLAADFYPDILAKSDEKLSELTAAEPPKSPEFADIIYRSQAMTTVVDMARHISSRSVPVLLEGESGTGKELFARAIHRASPRRDNPFVAINCGAIPAELVESELFGHEKGAFTGADRLAVGQFEAANNGTLFLDEIGELPLSAQVKLLRALQEHEIRRVGSTKSTAINVRIIAATNRNLLGEIAEGRFRADLFYRLAVGVIRLPPLREREGDISLLVEYFLKQINAENAVDSDWLDKSLTAAAKNRLLQHTWPGNVRELLNTIRRATIWTREVKIDATDIQQAILPNLKGPEDNILDRSIENGVELPTLIGEVARHYIVRTLKATGGNKTKAAELLGLNNYQTLTNWMQKHEIELDS